MAKTSEYDVTERAGRKVAGRVVVDGKPLVLTEDEAEHALREGTIVLRGKKLAKAFSEDTKALVRMRDEAQAVRSRGALPPADPVASAPASSADPAA